MPAAAISISTWPGPAAGSGTSSYRRTSGPPASCMTMAFIAFARYSMPSSTAQPPRPDGVRIRTQRKPSATTEPSSTSRGIPAGRVSRTGAEIDGASLMRSAEAIVTLRRTWGAGGGATSGGSAETGASAALGGGATAAAGGSAGGISAVAGIVATGGRAAPPLSIDSYPAEVWLEAGASAGVRADTTGPEASATAGDSSTPRLGKPRGGWGPSVIQRKTPPARSKANRPLSVASIRGWPGCARWNRC